MKRTCEYYLETEFRIIVSSLFAYIQSKQGGDDIEFRIIDRCSRAIDATWLLSVDSYSLIDLCQAGAFFSQLDPGRERIRRFFPNKNSFRKSVSNPAETNKYGRVIASSDICCTGSPGRLV
eukprot:COSAG01_NODE_306_length_19162_cov_14.196611_23_plen_121_part_00